MDIQILLALQNFREGIGSCLEIFLAFITSIAVDCYILLPGLIVFWVSDKRKGLYALFSYSLAYLENAVLKSAFCIYRPWIRSTKIKPLASVISGATGYSFPSGHCSSASGLYCGLISAYRKHKPLCIFFGFMIFLTMFSRLYVGVHTPQDVLAGLATGIFAAFIVTRANRFLEHHPDKDWLILLVTIALCAAALSYIYFKDYPMDYVNNKLLVDPAKMTIDGFKDPGKFFGVILGWFVERRWIRFEIKGSTANKVICCALGSLLFIFYWLVIMEPIGKAVGIGLVYFFLHASAPFLFMTVYPWCFAKLSRNN